MAFFKRLSDGLRKTRNSISSALNSVVSSFTKIDQDLFDEIEEILIMSDIGVKTSTLICEQLKQTVKDKRITDPSLIMNELENIIVSLLDGDHSLNISTKPSVVLVIGVNGVGKTTTIGKLASNIKNQGKKVILGAADTFRAAAIDQLEIWAERSNTDIVMSNEGADPTSVIYDTIASAKSKNADVIICDTAGRLHNKKNLMSELSKMYRVIKRELPESDIETLLVLDATTGQNAVNQALQFKESADITGIVLTKLDGTAKGGVVLAISNELKIPVKYIGVGEQIDDLQPFVPEDFAKALFGKEE